MRRFLWASLMMLTACSVPELNTEGARVRWSPDDPAGCRPVGTLRETEGGGLRSYDANKAAAQNRIRNEAAKLGANAVVLLTEVHGDSEEGAQSFSNGVPGLSTPNPRCSNCVLLTARAYACDLPPAQPVAETPAPKPVAPPIMAPPLTLPPPEPAAEPQPAAPPVIVVPAPAAPPVIIIIQPALPPPPPEK
ncbi:MAG: DUF4156 domain-containing protein [Minicystis sp.]